MFDIRPLKIHAKSFIATLLRPNQLEKYRFGATVTKLAGN